MHRRDIETFVRHRRERVKPATVSADFRALQQFSSGSSARKISTAPRRRRVRPIVPEQPIPVLQVA
jgi:hypothetical protein